MLALLAFGMSIVIIGGGGDVIREHVRDSYARLVNAVAAVSDADSERIDEFFRYGMSLNVAAAMGVLDLSCGAEWVREGGEPASGTESG